MARDGALWCWGRNDLGQVGNGRATGELEPPTHIAPGTRFTQVVAGPSTCAIDVDGVVWCWGFGLDDVLGDGYGMTRWTPRRVVLGTGP